MAFKFTDNSKAVKAEMQATMQKALESAALIVEASAKALAPVDSGELRDKIDHNVKNTANGPTATIGSPLDYALYVEYGTGEKAENGAGRKGGWSYQTPDGEWHFTRGSEPQPFLRPAFRNNKTKVQDIIGKEFKTTFGGGK